MAIVLSGEDRDRIQAAVKSAETRTSGEIVACLMSQSDRYGVAYLRAAVLCASIAALSILVVQRVNDGWSLGWLYGPEAIVALAVLTGLLGAAAAEVWPAFRRAMTGRARLRRMTRLQAYRTFVDESVFATENRTGILLFVSEFERRVEVLADAGINEVVAPEAWHEVVDLLVSRLREGRVVEGFEHAIRRFGAILREQGLEVKPRDPDELPNELRIRTRPDD